MENGEVPGLRHSETPAGFSSLGAADNLQPGPLGLPSPRAPSSGRSSARGCLPAVQAWEGEHQSYQTCSLRHVPRS